MNIDGVNLQSRHIESANSFGQEKRDTYWWKLQNGGQALTRDLEIRIEISGGVF